MISGLRPYPEYKGSGLLWADRVPAHWDVVPNRALIRRRKVLVGTRHPEYQLLSLTKEGVIIRDVESGKGKFSADMGTSQEVRVGDLVFCLFDVPETPRTVGLSRHSGMITGAYTVFECRDAVLAAFLDVFYRALDDRKLLSPLYSGLRNTIPPPRFLSTKTPLPPGPERFAIVRVLKHVELLIGRSIRAKRRLIALLNEQKQTIIHRAVTRGIDPDVRLKPSGVQWLGDVPEHWQVKRIKYLLRAVDRRSVNGDETLLSMRMYHGLVPFFEHYNRPPQSATLVGFKIVRPGQIVINRMQAGNGLIFASTLDGIVSPDYSVFDVCPDASPEYLGCLFRSPHTRVKFRAESKGLGTGTSGFLRLYDDRLGGIHIAFPERAEQERILALLEVQLAGINMSVARVEREIDLIREYRIRVIADVVTGQVDVREVSQTLPADIDDAESLVETDSEDEPEEPLEAVADHE